MIRLSYILLPRISTFPSRDGLQRLLADVREMGYDGAELNWVEPAGIQPAELAQMARGVVIAIPSLLTGEAYADGLCLSSANAAVRRKTTERLKQYVETAAVLESILVVGLLQGLRRDEPDPAVGNQRIADALRPVSESAAASGVDLVIEPVNHLQVGFNNSVAEVRSLIAAIGSNAVRPMVDTIHMNIEEQSLTQPILDCGAELRHVHLCESNAGPFGTGHIDFAAVGRALNQIGYSGFASVKVYRQATGSDAARSSIEYLRRIGFGR